MFRITKNIHNILQGVSHPDQRISAEEKQAVIDWITENANRYWFSEGGPLCPPADGGADIVIVSNFCPIPFCFSFFLFSFFFSRVAHDNPSLLQFAAHDQGHAAETWGGMRRALASSWTLHADESRLMTPKCRA